MTVSRVDHPGPEMAPLSWLNYSECFTRNHCRDPRPAESLADGTSETTLRGRSWCFHSLGWGRMTFFSSVAKYSFLCCWSSCWGWESHGYCWWSSCCQRWPRAFALICRLPWSTASASWLITSRRSWSCSASRATATLFALGSRWNPWWAACHRSRECPR